MKSLFLTFFAAALTCAAMAQPSVPRFSKYPVDRTGCAVYLPSPPSGFEKSLSEDGSEVYVGEVEQEEYFFAVIVVKFTSETSAGFESKEDKETVLENYLDFLKGQFGVNGAAGYGWGHTLEGAPAAVGVIDYWKDADGLKYALKAWCDGQFLSVLMLYGPSDYPHFNAQQMFLNGFRFPGQ